MQYVGAASSFKFAREMCSGCLANRTIKPHTDLQETAGLRITGNMLVRMYLERIKRPRHPLAECFFHKVVLLHEADASHGLQRRHRNRVWLAMHAPHHLATHGPNQFVSLQLINRELERWLMRHPGTHNLQSLSRNELQKDGRACLHGLAIKATTARASSAFFEMLAKKCLRRGDAHEEKDSRIVPSHHALNTILRESPMFMSDGTIAKVRRITLAFGAAFMECRGYSRRQNVLSSEIMLEVLRMQHLPLFRAALNLAPVSAYVGEWQVVATCSVTKCRCQGGTKRTYKQLC